MGKENLKKLLEKEAWVYEFLDEKYKADKELTCIAVNNGDVYEFVPEKLKQNKDVIIAAIGWDGLPEDMDEDWFQDMDILRALVDVEPWNYEEFPEEVQNDHAVALECVKVRGMVYESLPEELKADEEIAEAAIRNGQELKELVNCLGKPAFSTAEKMLQREDIVRAAIEANGGNQMIYAAKELWNNKALAELALAKGFCHLRCLPKELASDKKTVKRVLNNIPKDNSDDEYWQVVNLPEQLRFDEAFLMELIALREQVLKTIVNSKKYPDLASCFPELTVDFCKKAYQANKACFKYMNKEMKAAVKE